MLMDSGNAFPLLQKLAITMSICSLPKWVGSLVHLSYLQIVVETMDNEGLHILGNLPTLFYLELCRCHFPVERLVVGNQGFQCLKEFSPSKWCMEECGWCSHRELCQRSKHYVSSFMPGKQGATMALMLILALSTFHL